MLTNFTTMQWEATSVALTLAQAGTFGNPYALPTGPTAHLPPIPPVLNALIYRALGATSTAGYVAWAFDGAIWATLWGLLPWLSIRFGLHPRAGIYAGLAGALVPTWPGHGESLAALALAVLLAVFAGRWSSAQLGGPSRLAAFGLGVGWGVAFHIQPALVTVALALLAFEALWRPSRQARLACALTLLGMAAACLPWGWRNYTTFDAVFFVRSNFGLELRMGNHPGADAAMDVMDRAGGHVHPRAMESEAAKVQAMGEVPYMRSAGREALDWMRAKPATAARRTAWRFAHWWLGPLYDPPHATAITLLTLLALASLGSWWPRLTGPQRAALVIPLLTFPLVYYVVAYMPRYRQPVDWLFYLLAGAAVHAGVEALRRPWRSSTATASS
jgi:hypothetical protein